MAKSTSVIHSKPGDPILTARLPAELIAALNKWAEAKGLSRSEAIRRLIETGIGRSGDRITKLEAELKAVRQQLAVAHRAATEIVVATKGRGSIAGPKK